MKKICFCSSFLLLALTVFAQPPQKGDGPPKPPPPAERWKHDSTRMQLYVVLQPGQIAEVRNAFFNFYKETDGRMEKAAMPPSKEEMDRMRNVLKAGLQKALNAAQMERFRTFEKEILPPPHGKPHKNGGADV